MAHSVCCLCSGVIETEGFDIQKTCTVNSNTSLLLLLQSCTAQEFFFTNSMICKVCYHLLNELDTMRARVKQIEDKLKNYICKYSTKEDFSQQVMTNIKTEDECSVCFKKVSSNILKTHLKSHDSELNDLETNFDFDEVNSISEINPSLEDINLLSAEDNRGKNANGVKFEIIVGKNDVKKKKDDVKPYSCTQCPKKWRTLAEQKNHILSHSDERPYICEICGQAYKRRQALTVHVGMHKGINPYTCAYCKKSFTQKGALVRHTPIHTGEFPFQCDLCGKRFVHHTSFNIHKLSHTGEKSYKCDICGMLSISGSHLKRHMRVHTGEKRYTCGSCGKKFAERYNLVVHEKLHLGIIVKKKKLECQFCGNVYSCQVKLEEHLFRVHQKMQCQDPLG